MGFLDLAKLLLDKSGSVMMDKFIHTGIQYCPYCHTMTSRRAEGYYECDICNYSITDEEAENGEGYPTLESTYEDDIYNDAEFAEYRKPSECVACGGPYPQCCSTCEMFDDEDYNDYD